MRSARGQRGRELAGIRDRGRGEEELRLGAVNPGEAPQPAQHVRDVRAEDAPVDVRLVHDDVGEVVQDVRPAVVMRQDAHVEHVRVAEDQVRPLAHLPAPFGRRVAVVDRGPDAGHLQLGQRAQLILRERLGRVQVERTPLRLGREGVEHGQVEGERLAARGSGRDDHVAAFARAVPRFALVRVERFDPSCRERVADAWMQVVREGSRTRTARGCDLGVRKLLALEQVVPERERRHARIRRPPGRR